MYVAGLLHSSQQTPAPGSNIPRLVNAPPLMRFHSHGALHLLCVLHMKGPILSSHAQSLTRPTVVWPRLFRWKSQRWGECLCCCFSCSQRDAWWAARPGWVSCISTPLSAATTHQPICSIGTALSEREPDHSLFCVHQPAKAVRKEEKEKAVPRNTQLSSQ